MEIWKDVNGYEGLYQVSSEGRIKSLDMIARGTHNCKRIVKGRIRAQYDNKHGYFTLFICKNGEKKCVKVHALVATAFLPNPENKPTVNHKNGNKQDNRVENLEWATYSENHLHAFRELGKMPTWKGKLGKLSPSSKPIICTTTGISYAGANEASRVLKIRQSLISRVCLGQRNHTHGLTFKYA